MHFDCSVLKWSNDVTYKYIEHSDNGMICTRSVEIFLIARDNINMSISMSISSSQSLVIIALVTTTDNKKSHRARFGRNERCCGSVAFNYSVLPLLLSRKG